MKLDELLHRSVIAAVEAGKEILKVYETDFSVEHKDDASPLTLADQKSHEVIEQALKATPYNLLSEEGKDIPYEERKKWETFWLVDPLDGTKEFVKKNGEFTVNIALIKEGRAILGVIYIPVKDELYFACEGFGSFKLTDAVNKTSLNSSTNSLIAQSIKLPSLGLSQGSCSVLASRSHMSPETKVFIEELEGKFKKVDLVSSGSSIKLCLVAEGVADVYPRFAPTMEWDTAAGQAIVELAGGLVMDHTTQKVLEYNKQNLLNNWFVVKRQGFSL